MKLVMTLLVRDEADIVDAQIAFHLAAGVDLVIATDNRSEDGTTEILERYEREGRLRLIREPGDDLRQSEWLTRMARIAATDRHVPAFLDLPTAIENSRKDQTYNTPSVATLFLMDQQLGWILSLGGLEGAVERTRASAAHLYPWAEASDWASPFVTDPAHRSHVVATLDLAPPLDFEDVLVVLRANGILDTDPYRKLGRNQLRVAMFPAVDPDDVLALTHCLDWVVDHL